MDDRWGDTETWAGEGLRREVFFFSSGGEQLYGSLYTTSEEGRPSGVAICNSWAYEGNQADHNVQRIALASARAGEAGMVFHYPGFGDSQGELAEATMEKLTEATVDAVAEASRRRPGTSWALVGLMFGASVAALAAQAAGVERLLLVQPVLDVTTYFSRLERSARRAAIRVPARAGNAYGYPIPRRLLTEAPAIESAVAAALAGFEGQGAVVRYAEPPRDERVPERFEDVVLSGNWRFGARQKPELGKAASDWLRRPEAKADA